MTMCPSSNQIADGAQEPRAEQGLEDQADDATSSDEGSEDGEE